MKNLFFTILVLFGSAVLCTAGAIAEDSKREKEKSDMSYAFGMLIAEDLADTGLELNYNSFTQGFRDTMEKANTRLTTEEAIEKVQTAFNSLEALEYEKRQKEAEHNLVEGAAYLAENAKRSSVTVKPSGLQFEIITEGTGDMPDITDTVLVHYRGSKIDGTVFDSTYSEGFPMEIPLNRVIPGWSEGLQMMKEGGRAKLCLPPNLAYGEWGAPPMIGPNSVLLFEVELLAIIRPDEENDLEDSSEY